MKKKERNVMKSDSKYAKGIGLKLRNEKMGGGQKKGSMENICLSSR